jgi:hypothetical protein
VRSALVRSSALVMALALAHATAGAGQPAAAATDPVTLAIGQGFGAPPDIAIALDLVDESGRAPATLDPRAIAATIGSHAATVVRATPFEATRDGVAYIFLVDVSQSLSVSEMARVRDALRLWASSSHPADRFALIAFGDDVSTRVDFTGDRTAFQRAVDALAPSARTTQLHTAIERAIALSRRRDADLPARRVAVLLSDGQDEGSGLTADDVAALLRQDRLPIYAIGYSRLHGDARLRGFDSLRRLARNSGGLFGEVAASGAPPRASRTSGRASTATTAELYRAMQHAVTRVFSVALRCQACVGDGQLHRLQVQVKTGTRVLSDGIDLRLPVAASTSTSATGAKTGSGASGTSASKATMQPRPAPSIWTSPWTIAGIVGALLVLASAAGFAFWRVHRRRRDAASAADGGTAKKGSAATDGDRPGGARRPDVPDFIAVTCHFRGRHAPAPLTVTLRDRVTVGTDTDCAVVIPDDDDVAAAHCELAWESGYVTLRRLDAHHPTLVNGAAVSPSSTYRLESGDVVLLGRTEFRVLFGEAEEALS